MQRGQSVQRLHSFQLPFSELNFQLTVILSILICIMYVGIAEIEADITGTVREEQLLYALNIMVNGLR